MGLADDFPKNLKGAVTILFIGGHLVDVIILDYVQDVRGYPMILEADNGEMYNWTNVISIKKRF